MSKNVVLVTGRVIATIAFIIGLVGCGGGGGGSTSSTPDVAVLKAILDSFGLSLTEAEFGGGDANASGADGTADDGAVIANAAVALVDTTGKKVTGTTDSRGYYRVRIDGFSPPFVVSVTKLDGTIWYAPSVAPVKVRGFVTVNLTGLTDKLAYDVAVAAGQTSASQLTPAMVTANQTALVASKAALNTLLTTQINTAGLNLSSFDPVTTPFRPDGTGYDKLLQTVAVSKSATTGSTVIFPKWTVGGAITGLGSLSGLVLSNNGETLAVPANAGRFSFSGLQDAGSGFAVAIATQPAGAYCSVSAGTGLVSASTTSSVKVDCNSATYSVGGGISGLGNSSGLELQLGAQTLAVPANATIFTFPTGLIQGSSYAVTVKTQPAGRTCGVSNGSGVIGTNAVNLVSVNCSTFSYSLGGTVTGLGASGLVLANAGQLLSVPANITTFSFAATVASGSSYNVTIQTQPVGYACVIGNGSGTVTTAAVNNVAVTCSANQVVNVSTFAGSGVAGYVEGTSTAASFDHPAGLAVDAQGNLFVSDAGNFVIRKVTPAGVVSTYAGTGKSGLANGPANSASFASPSGIAVDSAGNVYVAEYGANLIRKITPAGMVSTLAGGAQGHLDGTGSAASFNHPRGLAVDKLDNVYVADQANNMIRKITPAGVVTTLMSQAMGGNLNGPYDVAVDGNGTVYIADTFSHTIKTLTSAGVLTTLAGNMNTNLVNGIGTAASFSGPVSLVLDAAGNIYVSDNGQNVIRKITPSAVVSTYAGTGTAGYQDGVGTSAMFNKPWSIRLDAAGNVFVLEPNSSRIRKIAP